MVSDIESAHREVLSDLERFLGYNVERVPLMQMNSKERLWGRHSCLGIEINEVLFNFSNGNGYCDSHEFDIARRLLKCGSIRDLFKNVLRHEYFHEVFDNKYWANIRCIVSQNMLNYENISNDPIMKQISKQVLSIHEAFAFWGEDRIGAYKRLNEDDIPGMEHVNPRTTKFFYKLFHEISEENSDRFVTKNLSRIVKNNIKDVKDTKLKTVAEALNDRIWFPLGSLKDYKLPPIIRLTDMQATVYDPTNKYRYNTDKEVSCGYKPIIRLNTDMVARVYDPMNRYKNS